jgi:hypothetical protein
VSQSENPSCGARRSCCGAHFRSELPFSPPPRARLALWRVMVGGVWGARAWWCVCGGGRNTCIMAQSWWCLQLSHFSRYPGMVGSEILRGAQRGHPLETSPPCLGAPVQCTGPFSVQLGSGSYDMPILCPIMVELGDSVESARILSRRPPAIQWRWTRRWQPLISKWRSAQTFTPSHHDRDLWDPYIHVEKAIVMD